jgi:hypothetical protein
MERSRLTTEAEIWSRAIHPEIGDLSGEAAREWLRLRLSEADSDKVRELLSKSNAVGRVLEFLKA